MAVASRVSRRIRGCRWRVDEAINAQEAITALEEGTYCVVVTDIRMGPGLSGWDVGRACAAKGTPVIFVSGNLYDASEAVPHSLFFAKPCEAAEIVSACDRWRGGQLKEHEADNSQ
jgi:DNA-binding NtrC family response regulator